MNARNNPAAPARPQATRERMLDVAERLMQTRGYNGFSFADIAAEIGISKASLHHHFSTKAQLGEAVVARYTAAFDDAVRRIRAKQSPVPRQLAQYVEIFSGVVAQQRMCLCGMLAAEYETLPAPIQAAVRAFFTGNVRWLATVIGEGRAAGSLRPSGPDRPEALKLLGGLEGAMLVGRAQGKPAGFRASARNLLDCLRPCD